MLYIFIVKISKKKYKIKFNFKFYFIKKRDNLLKINVF